MYEQPSFRGQMMYVRPGEYRSFKDMGMSGQKFMSMKRICPMHKADPGPAHQERAYEFVACPMKGSEEKSDIDPPTWYLRTRGLHYGLSPL
ncbi:hypothetical protein F7725_028404 [Dissostichus mawsoni]|uniref:Beta/gamma crystallin 'Greek key' domain-containing protein n=1 Tax=Dissostichus mawsoni TaxID=36200 RepID=A0A7J5XFK1_DISMA|nr:hypothetical protein F7725_028404 [Dissostichus mawsoni]